MGAQPHDPELTVRLLELAKDLVVRELDNIKAEVARREAAQANSLTPYQKDIVAALSSELQPIKKLARAAGKNLNNHLRRQLAILCESTPPAAERVGNEYRLPPRLVPPT
jgi:16S rRNA A1518/A1519 N6-dimethyltransferase RsmA/KsgA/DIM1 with predicted DNA glycosylase/AP lyase activity